MSEQYFTRPNVQPVITNIGTTPEQRQMSTSEFKAKFDEMPEAIQQYIKETLLIELDAFKQEFMTHEAENVSKVVLITEPYDQLTQTTVNLGFRPKTLIIEAVIINTKYSSVGYSDENLGSLIKYTYAQTGNATISGGTLIRFDDDGSGNRYISGAVTYTESGILITWSKSSDALVGASGNRRLIISAMTHGEG